jgi:hypothetical protein
MIHSITTVCLCFFILHSMLMDSLDCRVKHVLAITRMETICLVSHQESHESESDKQSFYVLISYQLSLPLCILYGSDMLSSSQLLRMMPSCLKS